MVSQGKYFRVLWIALIALLVMAAAAPFGSVKAQGPTATPDPELELIGVITAVGPDSFVVNGVTVLTTGAEIKVQLQVGAQVKVHGQMQASLTLRAREVEGIAATDVGVRAGEAEFVGVMTRFIGQVMVVNGMTVNVSAAEIHGRLDPGGLVWVHATWDATNNVWIAREVGPFGPTRNMSDDLPRFGQGEWEITGTLTAWTPESATISGLTIDIRNAEIDDSLSLTMGALVKVQLRLMDGQFVAIKLERGDTERLREGLRTRGRSGSGGFDDNSNSNDNSDDDDNGNFNGNDNGNDNDDNGNDDNGNDNGDDDGDNDNGGGGNDNRGGNDNDDD